MITRECNHYINKTLQKCDYLCEIYDYLKNIHRYLKSYT